MVKSGFLKVKEKDSRSSKSDWVSIKIDMDSIDIEGTKIKLKDVPAEYNKKRNITRIDIDEVIKRS